MNLLMLVWLVLLQQIRSQTVIVAVEDLSRNLNILCDLGRHYHPLYWRIQDRVYDLYSVPEIFRVRGQEALSLTTVDRRMDGWALQCFNIEENGNLNAGVTSVLNVLFDPSTQSPDVGIDLLQSSQLGRVILKYQELKFTSETVTLGWNYYPSSISAPCVVSLYELDVYSQAEISTELQSSLMPSRTFSTRSRNITIDSLFFKDENGPYYFRVAVAQGANTNCATTAYYHDLIFNGTMTNMHVEGNSANFEIPSRLMGRRELQLVWLKDESTQCVCPPVDPYISQCACNVENSNSSLVTITNGTLSISNLPQVNGEGELSLYFVDSLSNGCRDTCHLRSIVEVYRIVITRGFPQAPNISNSLCFSIPNNPIDAEVYEVTLVDSTGTPRLSSVYSTRTTHCLNITSDLYPDVCGPFQLTVAAVNRVGREATVLTIGAATEPYPCNCYQQRERFEVTSSATHNTANITLSCNRSDDFVASLIILGDEPRTEVSIPCNTPRSISLVPLRSYTVVFEFMMEGGSLIMCPVSYFNTSSPETLPGVNEKATGTNISLVVALPVSMLLICIVAIAALTITALIVKKHYFRRTKRRYNMSTSMSSSALKEQTIDLDE